jgi:zinc transport system substrate-binding protein
MRKLLAIVVAVVVVAAGCSSRTTQATNDSSPDVVASIFPLFDAASFIGGKYLHIANLLPLDPFGPVPPEKAEQIRNAKLVVLLGHGTQPEIERIAGDRVGPTIHILDYFQTRPDPSGAPVDPYVWTNVDNMRVIVTKIKEALADLDPEHAGPFEHKAFDMQRRLDDLDRRMLATFRTCERKQIVTDDPHYQFLAKRYGLEQIPAVTGEALQEAVRLYGPEVVYFGDLPSIPEARDLRSRLGVKSSSLDPLAVETDQARRGGANYFTVTELNNAALWEGLGCTRSNG